MKIDLVSAFTLGMLLFASIFAIAALADTSIKHQNQICQEGC